MVDEESKFDSSDTRQKPVLIYDGDCDFCTYSVRYWQKLTGDRVNYQPYQQVYQNYPSISIDEFKRAVQYITPDHQVASGAKASLLTVNHVEGGSWWLTYYQRIPGFSWLAEKSYHFISTHRNLFYRVCLLCWGRQPEPPTYDIVLWIFLRLFGLIFLSAFYSFATQALGLIGSHGILPLTNFVNMAHEQLGSACYWYFPMVFWLNSSDLAIMAVCWSGVALSVLLILNVLPRLSLFLLYVLYLSLIYAGQVFMTFQWDMLLLETAVILIFAIRYHVLGIWLLRWLVFRYIFASGIVKIASGDPAWWDMTALNYHFLTQPLPTPLAWYAHYLPEIFLKFSTSTALFIELVMPFLIFCPRRIRFIAGYSILLMQFGIILTGNYNFFNLTSVLLCLSLFDDASLQAVVPNKLIRYMKQPTIQSPPWKLTNLLMVIFTIVTIMMSIVQFNSKFIGALPVTSSRINSYIAPFQIVNTYGPFAVMTRKRYEIIIEGSDDGVHWREYSFVYKPGDLKQKPKWNIPFQPRLDWQMWFAALGPPDASPWFSSFLQRLLENSPEVVALMADNPFKEAPPVFVRALYFDYTYTTMNEYKTTGAWWNRTLLGVYYPTVSLN